MIVVCAAAQRLKEMNRREAEAIAARRVEADREGQRLAQEAGRPFGSIPTST